MKFLSFTALLKVSLAHDGTRIDVASTFHTVVLRSASFRIEIYSPRVPIEVQIDEFGQLRVNANAGDAIVFVPTSSSKGSGASRGLPQIIIDIRRAFRYYFYRSEFFVTIYFCFIRNSWKIKLHIMQILSY